MNVSPIRLMVVQILVISLLLTLLMEMRRRTLKRGLASLCVGGGQGAAFILERDP